MGRWLGRRKHIDVRRKDVDAVQFRVDVTRNLFSRKFGELIVSNGLRVRIRPRENITPCSE